MKRLVLICACLLLFPVFLTSCIEITNVDSPDFGILGRTFEATVNVTFNDTEDNGEDGNTGTPVFSVNLPDGWEIVECTALYNATAYDCAISEPGLNSLLDFFYSPFEGNWNSRRMPLTQTFVPGETIDVTWTIRPTSAGDFELHYWAVVDEGNGNYLWDLNQDTNITFNHPITIAAQIPTLNEYAIFLLAGLLMMSSIIFLKKKKVAKLRYPFAFILFSLISAMIFFQAMETNAQGDEAPSKLKPTKENIKSVSADENPRAAILEKFDLTAEQVEILNQLSDENLQTVLQIFEEAENPEDVKCMLINSTPPKVKCIDCAKLPKEK